MKVNFLYTAINDTQATIKALDVKLGFIFVIIFAPLMALDSAFKTYMYIYTEMNDYIFVCRIEILLWILSVIYLFLGIGAISNPKVIKSNKSTFYDGDVFKISIIQSIFENGITPKKSIEQKIKELPSNENDLIEVLIEEKIKLAYIRDVKIKRSTICTVLLFTWLILGALIWAVTLTSSGLK